MSLFPNFYSSLSEYSKKGGHVRRHIMINTTIDKPVEWSALLNNVIKLAVKLADIEKELKQLGHEHAINNHGTLPY
ncbi:unnamed protein product [Rotaria socialis]